MRHKLQQLTMSIVNLTHLLETVWQLSLGQTRKEYDGMGVEIGSLNNYNSGPRDSVHNAGAAMVD